MVSLKFGLESIGERFYVRLERHMTTFLPALLLQSHSTPQSSRNTLRWQHKNCWGWGLISKLWEEYSSMVWKVIGFDHAVFWSGYLEKKRDASDMDSLATALATSVTTLKKHYCRSILQKTALAKVPRSKLQRNFGHSSGFQTHQRARKGSWAPCLLSSTERDPVKQRLLPTFAFSLGIIEWLRVFKFWRFFK